MNKSIEVTPPDIIMTLHGYQPVTKQIAHQRNHNIKAIKKDLMVLELVTPKGSRCYGFDNIYIGSDLKMHCSGFSPNFEALKKWKRVKPDK